LCFFNIFKLTYLENRKLTYLGIVKKKKNTQSPMNKFMLK